MWFLWGFFFLLLWATMKVKVTQSCPALCDRYSPWNFPGQILECVAFPFSRGSSHPRDQCIAGSFLNSWATKEVLSNYICFLKIRNFCYFSSSVVQQVKNVLDFTECNWISLITSEASFIYGLDFIFCELSIPEIYHLLSFFGRTKTSVFM